MMGTPITDPTSSSFNICIDVNQEDDIPEDKRVLNEQEDFPETYEDPEQRSDVDSEASQPPIGPLTRKRERQA